jgi:hypothetical protein
MNQRNRQRGSATTKASLTLLKLPITAEQLAAMFETLTGRKPTEQEMDEVRRCASRPWKIHRSSHASSCRFADFLSRRRATSLGMEVHSTHAN